MANYTLKLSANNTTNYRLYIGGTLVSDADITTLFATAGEAYFTVDLDLLTPTNLTTLDIINSTDAVVVSNTGLTLADDKNFKGTWGNSATSFTSFVELAAYGLDESQLAQLADKIPSEGIRAIDVSNDTTPLRNLGTTIARGEIVKFYQSPTTPSASLRVSYAAASLRYFSWSTSYGKEMLATRVGSGAYCLVPTSGGSWIYRVEYSGVGYLPLGIVNDLTSTSQLDALAANQGRILNNHIGDITTLTTTDKTSTVAAINELEARIAALEGN